MKKQIFFLAVAALALASCSSENDVVQTPDVVNDQTTADVGAVAFDSYINRSTTRSGDFGTMTTSTPNTRTLRGTGFGVFGYYTDNNDYNGLTIPNFFYNQKITYSATPEYWTYDPVKYWPNEYGNSAISDDNDKVSYFAYAPYVDVVPGSGKPADQTYGITQLSRNSATGDPYVKYIASFDWQKAVDLLWGVVPDANTKWDITSGQTQTLQAGMPWLNIERPFEAKTQTTATQKVKFDFKHALSKLNVVIDYDADVTEHTDADANAIDPTKTRIYIRSVSFTGFTMKGALNLNNVQPNTPLWMAYDASNDLEIGEVTTLNDGRKDGKEGVGGAVAPNEKNVFINPSLIQKSGWTSDNKGVLNQAQNLFAFPASDKVATDMIKPAPTKKVDVTSGEALALSTLESQQTEGTGVTYTTGVVPGVAGLGNLMLNWPIMVIPNGDEVKVTIVYDVETVDKNLALTVSDGSTLGSSIESRITKTITFNGEKNYMEAGKKYIIKLHIGMNSVKFDAAVTDWDATPIEGETWLPDNIVSYQAPGVYNYVVDAGATVNAAFKLTGFAPKEIVSNVARADAPITYDENTTRQASNVGEVNITDGTGDKLTIVPNKTVLKVTTDNAVKYTGAVSGKEVILNLVQNAAQPDGNKSTLAISTTGDVTTGTFTLNDGASSPNALKGAIWTGSTRNVQIISATRNGVPMTELNDNETPTTATQFKTASGDGTTAVGTITIGAPAKTGEVFIFTIKAGDAGEFTVKYTHSTTP